MNNLWNLERAILLLKDEVAKLKSLVQELRQRLYQGGGYQQGGGGSGVNIGVTVSTIAAGGSGSVQPYNVGTSSEVGDPVTVINLDPDSPIPEGKRVAYQTDQFGNLVGSPVQC